MKTFTFFIMAFVFAGAGLFAQQRYMLNHETASPLYYNPGIITQMGQNRIALIHRQQWLGNQGPITQALSVSGRLPNSGLSLGGYLSNDKNGPIRRLSFRAAASYNLVETSKHTLGLGIYLGLLNQAIKAADFNVYDPLIGASEQIPYTGLDAGLGFQYRYSWGENGYVNFGAATIQLPQSFEMGPTPDSSAIFELPMHLLLNMGASFPINDQMALEPQALIRSTPGPFELKKGLVDFYLNLYFYKRDFRVGAGYRSHNSGYLFMLNGPISNKLSASVFAELHPQWGTSFEVGISYLLGTSDLPEPPVKYDEGFWESQAALQARARNLNGAPRNMNITSVISQDNIILEYKFADEENTYQLNNSPSVNVVINDIRNLLEDASAPQRRYRLTDLEAVEITIFSPQSIGELRLIDVDQEYGGEWGSPLNIIYNSLPQPERIDKGAIRSLAFTLLKMQAIQKMFNNRGLNPPVFNFRIGENSENKEISIELKVKKDY